MATADVDRMRPLGHPFAEGDRAVALDTVVVSTQHEPNLSLDADLRPAIAAEVVHSQHIVRIRFKPSWLRYAWRPLVGLFPDTARVLLVLLRQLALRRPARGEFRMVPFRPGRPAGAYDTTRRALAKGAGSFAPNTYVVGIDEDRELLLVHQLEPSSDASTLDPLELG